MKRILYLLHTPWGWIKQRPHFLAELLAQDFKVDVWYRMSNQRRTKLNSNFSDGNLEVKGFRMIPYERIPIISNFNMSYLNKFSLAVKNIDFDSYDYIWVTDPLMYDCIPKTCKVDIIYDCMDDSLEFPYIKKYPRLAASISKLEKELLNKAKHVFCSAETLSNTLQNRYLCKRKIQIVNNAIASSVLQGRDEISTNLLDDFKKPVVYIGTISEWFDFDTILRALEEFNDLEIVIIGPIRCPNIPQHKRMHFLGSVEHSLIKPLMSRAHALIMPFVVNDLIKSVNPVKLYEYIYSGKPIIASRYGETDKFSKYISLYTDYEEFRKFINDNIQNESKIDNSMKKEMKEFALNNTWEDRYQFIKKTLC